MSSTAFILALLIACGPGRQEGPAPRADGASAQESTRARPTVNVDALPIDIEKIQQALARQPAIVIGNADFDTDTGLPTFRTFVEAREPTIETILGPDYLRGPVPAGAMSHQEFLNMVTPTDVQGYAAFSNGQAATVALTSFALQWGLKTALEKFHQARDDRAKAAARKEVQDALEALRQARLAAGLPVK